MVARSHVGLCPARTRGVISLDDLGFDEGAHLLVERALRAEPTVVVTGASPSLAVDLPAWARSRGHHVERAGAAFRVTRTTADRWRGAERAAMWPCRARHRRPAGAGGAGRTRRGGAPELDLPLQDPQPTRPRGLRSSRGRAVDPATAIPGDAPVAHPAESRDAIVQIMTY